MRRAATSRPLARILFWALIGLILFGIVTILVAIPNGALI
jgi:FtsH-binding integral membrane protein